MVGNKNDLYYNEEVTYDEGLELANQIKAIYRRISAKSESGGINELFENIGKKLLEPNFILLNKIKSNE